MRDPPRRGSSSRRFTILDAGMPIQYIAMSFFIRHIFSHAHELGGRTLVVAG
jgi:hypothetical protein